MGVYIAIGVAVVIILWAIISYNGFIKSKLGVDNSFSQIKIQCKKRFDLVPNLVETVKGYAKHEQETFENIVNARNRGVSANDPTELAEASNQLTQTLGKLFALSEAYPDLKANTNFIELQRDLTAIEKAIAVSRQFYNDSVMIYNRKIMVFPGNIIAGMFGFKQADFFDTPDAETQNVKVSF